MTSLKLVRQALGLLPTRDRWILSGAAVGQILLSLLDLMAILLMGLIAAAAATQIGQAPASGILSRFSTLLPEDGGALILAASLIGVVLISKSLFSLWLTRRIYRFLANRQAIVAGDLAERLLTRPLPEIRRRSSQDTAFALSTGVNAATVWTLGSAMVIVAEVSLTAALFLGLFVVDPLVAVFTVAFFGGLAVILQLLLGKWASSIGEGRRHAEVGSTETIQQAIRTYRELAVTGRRGLFVGKFTNHRRKAASVQADEYILSQAGKYVFEIALVLGGGALIFMLSLTRDVAAAVAVLTVFLLATSRLFPSLLRLQSAFISIRESSGLSAGTFELVHEMGAINPDSLARSELDIEDQTLLDNMKSGYPGFVAEVVVDSVKLTYPDASRPTIWDISLRVEPGSSLAIVGPTGSGKSTLADAILGVLDINSGSIQISGLDPRIASSQWPGVMGYVPQDVALVSGSVRDNVALGISPAFIDDNLVWEAIERAHLSEYLRNHRESLDTLVGEDGVKLSGGQRQRLGIARALYSRPRLLILDEATSALDADTELSISETLRSLTGQVTTIIIAHRLATVRDCDQVIYMDAGCLLASGSFDEVRASVPDFDHQARLLGLGEFSN